MKIGISGSRSFDGNFKAMKKFVKILEDYERSYGQPHLVSGGAKGIDSWAQDYAKNNGCNITIFYPNYKKYPSKVAPLKRNEDIVVLSDKTLIFWDGISAGSMNTKDLCKELQRDFVVYKWNGENFIGDTTNDSF